MSFELVPNSWLYFKYGNGFSKTFSYSIKRSVHVKLTRTIHSIGCLSIPSYPFTILHLENNLLVLPQLKRIVRAGQVSATPSTKLPNYSAIIILKYTAKCPTMQPLAFPSDTSVYFFLL